MALAIALTKHGDAEEALQLGRAALAYQLPLGDQWGTIWVVHIRMWSLARLITDQIAAGNTSRSTLVKLATEIAYLAGGVKTQRARLGVLIENMGPFADETSTAEKVARDVLGQETYADVEKRGSRLFAERSELQRIALGTLSIRHIVDPPQRAHRAGRPCRRPNRKSPSWLRPAGPTAPSECAEEPRPRPPMRKCRQYFRN